MKKIFFSLFAKICLIGILAIPNSGFAFMTALSETGMRSTIAQAGMALSTVDDVALNMDIDTIAFGSAGKYDEYSAYLSFNDIVMNGVISSNEPVSVGISTELNPYTGSVDAGVNIKITDVEIDIEHFEIGSITVGAKPGEGASFGRIIMKDYHAKISGDIRITTH